MQKMPDILYYRPSYDECQEKGYIGSADLDPKPLVDDDGTTCEIGVYKLVEVKLLKKEIVEVKGE